MITKEEFTQIEKQYNAWLAKHPKGDENYKYFTHMRRTVEFAKHYSQKQIKKLNIGAVIKSLPEPDEIRMKARELDEKDFAQWMYELQKGNIL